MNISIFAPRPRKMSSGIDGRLSSIIRGSQIADKIGAKLNPLSGFENDVCIYVKPHIDPGDEYQFSGIPYLDVLDAVWAKHTLRKYPNVTAILCSKVDYDYMRRRVRNKQILIPQHHCNFEREKRQRGGINIVGVIGAPAAFEYIPLAIRHGLQARGIDLVQYTSGRKRAEVCEFYRNIDIQLVWRPDQPMGNPLKIINGMAYGVPTIARNERFFDEVDEYYFPVESPEEWLNALDKLRASPAMYTDYSARGMEEAEEYHIDNISELYLELAR